MAREERDADMFEQPGISLPSLRVINEEVLASLGDGTREVLSEYSTGPWLGTLEVGPNMSQPTRV